MGETLNLRDWVLCRIYR